MPGPLAHAEPNGKRITARWGHTDSEAGHGDHIPQPPALILAGHRLALAVDGHRDAGLPDGARERHRVADACLPRRVAHVHQHAVLDGLRPAVLADDLTKDLSHVAHGVRLSF